jgi:ribonuclease HIII
LNVLLAECHAKVIVDVMKRGLERGVRIDLAISDKFGKRERLTSALTQIECGLRVEQLVGGEAVPQVAAASILARAEFVRRMQELSKEFGLDLPKGASAQVDQVGRQFVTQLGQAALERAAKKHFKNFQRSLAADLFR